jgi:isopenicillin N synthase-like dioxygenase
MDHPSPVRTVDLDRWRRGSPDARAAVAAAFDASMREAGFIVLVGHGVDHHLSESLRAAALEFFELDDATKATYRAEALGTRGWLPTGAEANAYASGEESPPDLKESYVCTTSELPGHEGVLPALWPDEVPGLRAAANAFLAAVEAVHLELLGLAATAIGLEDTGYFAHRAGMGSALNINWYPPLTRVGPPAPGQWRIGPHTDFGTITVLDRQPGLGGLQVQLDDGSWVDAPWVPDSLLVNGGDLMAAWSNGRWRSAPHRVLPPAKSAPDESLVSLIYFCEADPDVVIAPLPGLDRPTAFEPFRAGDYLQEKLDRISVGGPVPPGDPCPRVTPTRTPGH